MAAQASVRLTTDVKGLFDRYSEISAGIGPLLVALNRLDTCQGAFEAVVGEGLRLHTLACLRNLLRVLGEMDNLSPENRSILRVLNEYPGLGDAARLPQF